ncbi:Hypothetical protein UVM_LOCUS489 [uncultured virus]|nr:Hypothetical protein UVM_LOCUS489 [uncultured virus]
MHRKNPAEEGLPLAYLQQLRLAYYLQLREQALTGRCRIAYVHNEPFADVELVLDRMLRAPSGAAVRALFADAPALGDEASAAQVSAAFARVRAAYDRYYSATSTSATASASSARAPPL